MLGVSPEQPWSFQDFFKGLGSLFDIFNVKGMAAHDRKDLLISVLTILVPIALFLLKVFSLSEMKWIGYIWLAFIFLRSILHTFHYEARHPRKKK